GAEIYRQTLPLADLLYVTEVQADVEGDAFFPAIDWTLWQTIKREAVPAATLATFAYDLVVYRKNTVTTATAG
ncbi:MAG: dihydrofolate reductase, partial [Spongiibacteraceae bacterium]